MDWLSFLYGVILGVVAIISERGARRMLAPTIIKRRLIIGHISRLVEGSTVTWYIPIHVKANALHKCIDKLFPSSIDDVTASITLASFEKRYNCYWINPGVPDDFRTSLRIGTKRDIGIAEQYSNNNIIQAYNDPSTTLPNSDENIQLELKYGDEILGQWIFRKALAKGMMQEVEPIKGRSVQNT